MRESHRRRSRDSDSDDYKRSKKRKKIREVTEVEINEYLTKKAEKKAMSAAKKLKDQNVFGYSNEPFLRFKSQREFYKCAVDQYESDLLSVAHSFLLSMTNKNLQISKLGLCKGSCIRFALAKLLRHSGYDAALCNSKWQGCSKVHGGSIIKLDLT